MRIRSVKYNNRKKIFEIKTSTKVFPFPYTKTDPPPTPGDPVKRLFVDEELGREGFTYEPESGRAGTVHIEQVLEYNQDPNHLRDLLLYRLTLEAQKRIAASPLSKREIIRRLGTWAAQLLSTAGSDGLLASLSYSWFPCFKLSSVTWISWCVRRPPEFEEVHSPSHP